VRRTITKLILLVLVLFLQWMFLPFLFHPWPHGEMVDVRYRQKERLSVFWDSKQHPSAASRAAFDVEMRRMHTYIFWMTAATASVLALADWGVIHFVLDRERKRPRPNQPLQATAATPRS